MLFKVPGAMSSLALPGTVTRPALLACLYCRWLPRVATSRQPSFSIVRITSATFTCEAYQGMRAFGLMAENGESNSYCGAKMRPCKRQRHFPSSIVASAIGRARLAIRASTGFSSSRSRRPAFIAARCAQRRRRSHAISVTTRVPPRRRQRDSGRVFVADRKPRPDRRCIARRAISSPARCA